jgi:4-aminobutyrate aminotransferase-like enzyme
VAAVIDAALQRGLILLKAGVHGNCIRVLCPLTVEDAVLDEALAVWEEALASVLG